MDKIITTSDGHIGFLQRRYEWHVREDSLSVKLKLLYEPSPQIITFDSNEALKSTLKELSQALKEQS